MQRDRVQGAPPHDSRSLTMQDLNMRSYWKIIFNFHVLNHSGAAPWIGSPEIAFQNFIIWETANHVRYLTIVGGVNPLRGLRLAPPKIAFQNFIIWETANHVRYLTIVGGAKAPPQWFKESHQARVKSEIVLKNHIRFHVLTHSGAAPLNGATLELSYYLKDGTKHWHTIICCSFTLCLQMVQIWTIESVHRQCLLKKKPVQRKS